MNLVDESGWTTAPIKFAQMIFGQCTHLRIELVRRRQHERSQNRLLLRLGLANEVVNVQNACKRFSRRGEHELEAGGEILILFSAAARDDSLHPAGLAGPVARDELHRPFGSFNAGGDDRFGGSDTNLVVAARSLAVDAGTLRREAELHGLGEFAFAGRIVCSHNREWLIEDDFGIFGMLSTKPL